MQRIWLKSYPESVPTEIILPSTVRSATSSAASIDRDRDRTAIVSIGRTMFYGELDPASP